MVPQSSGLSGSTPHRARTVEQPFAAGLQYIARRLRFSVRHLSDADKQFLADVGRTESRYQMKSLERLAEIAERSERAEDREALAEFIRARSLRSTRTILDARVAFNLETQATGPADVAQRAFEQHPCRATKDAVEEALRVQLFATRCALDSAAATPVD